MNDNGTKLSDEQVTNIVKKKNRGSDWMKELSDDGGNLEPGDNSRFVRHALASWNLPAIDISDEQQVADRIELYFKYCVENDRRPQVIGLCNWLGISRQTLNEWKNGEVRSATHGDIVKRAYGVMEEMWTDYMLYGKVSPPTGIFLAKNWYGYKDVADVVVTPNNPYQAATDAELDKKYLADMGTEDDE